MSAEEPDYAIHTELLYLIHELSRSISTYFDNAMARHKLTHAQWWALMHILNNEGCSQAELARLMGTGPAAAGQLLDKLESKGWIERVTDEHDNRLRRVFLASGAVPVFMLMNGEGARLFRHVLNDVSDREERQLVAGLRKLKQNTLTSVES